LPASGIGHGHHELRATYPTQPAAREICLATFGFGAFLKMRNCMPTGAESNLSSRPPCRGPRTCSSLQRLARAADQIWIFLRPGPVFPMLTPAGPGPAEAFKSAAGCRQRSIVRFRPPPASCHCDRSPLHAAPQQRANPDARCLAAAWPTLVLLSPGPCSPARLLLGFRFENPARSMLDRAEGGSRPMDHGHGCHRGLILPDVILCARDLRLLHLQCSQYSTSKQEQKLLLLVL
jgi:hypothetical protein